MSEELKPCPFCGGEAPMESGRYQMDDVMYSFAHVECLSCGACGSGFTEAEKPVESVEALAADAWNRRADRTWHDFSDELPPVGASVLCRGRNSALYVGKPVTFKGNGTRKVWVPRGDQYRTPEKWMEIEDAD